MRQEETTRGHRQVTRGKDRQREAFTDKRHGKTTRGMERQQEGMGRQHEARTDNMRARRYKKR